MQSSDMKNMVVLKNFPSNIVEEAIIIFKETQNVKQKEVIKSIQNSNSNEIQSKSKDYILKEAEMLVSDYIGKIENKKKSTYTENLMKKYGNLKKYSICSTVFIIINLIINFIY